MYGFTSVRHIYIDYSTIFLRRKDMKRSLIALAAYAWTTKALAPWGESPMDP